MKIEEIWKYFKDDLLQTEEKIRENLKTVAPAIATVGHHLLMSGGKRIRPMLVILCSSLLGYRGEMTSILACSTESIHTASLLHDDIVDGAHMRRGKPTAHSLWGEQAVVLVGDYLYSNALRLINLLKNQKIMDAFTTATAKMSEGELLQLKKKEQSKNGTVRITEEDYYQIIIGKTAILMSAACRGGAVIGNASQAQEDALTSFGLKFGMAFQIADDILDYIAEKNVLGKGLGKDLEEGKVTLPIIYLLNDTTAEEAEKIKTIIMREKCSESDLAYVLDLLHRYNSIQRSYSKARVLIDEAKNELSGFDDSFEKASLMTLSEYVLKRKN